MLLGGLLTTASVFALACCAFGLSPRVALAADTTVGTFSELQSAITKSSGTADDPDEITITADIDVTTKLVVNGTKHIVLQSSEKDGGGRYALNDDTSRTAVESAMILVEDDAQLTVRDITLSGQESGSVAGVALEDNAALVIGSDGGSDESTRITGFGRGAVRCGDTKGAGGNVSIEMLSGTISGNTSSAGGAFNCYRSATIRIAISGGIISSNAGDMAGVVASNSAKVALTISGGKLSDNTAKKNAGAIYLSGADSSLEMTGGEISNNTSGTTTGGINLNSSAEAHISGGAISDNTVTDKSGRHANNVYAKDSLYLGDEADIPDGIGLENGSALFIKSELKNDVLIDYFFSEPGKNGTVAKAAGEYLLTFADSQHVKVSEEYLDAGLVVKLNEDCTELIIGEDETSQYPTVYVGGDESTDGNAGNTKDKPVNTINAALVKVQENGTIVVLDDTGITVSSSVDFEKNVTVRGEVAEGEDLPVVYFHNPSVSADVTFANITISLHKSGGVIVNPEDFPISAAAGESASLVLDNVKIFGFVNFAAWGEGTSSLEIRNCGEGDLYSGNLGQGVIGFANLDSVTIDNSIVRNLTKSYFKGEGGGPLAPSVTLENGSTLLVSEVGNLASDGTGNTLLVDPDVQMYVFVEDTSGDEPAQEAAGIPVISGTLSLEGESPITLSYDGDLAEGLELLTSGDAENESLVAEGFALAGAADEWVLVKDGNSIKVAAAPEEPDVPSGPVTPSRPSYEVEVPEPEHGSADVSPSSPHAGDTVTITPEADDGFELVDVSVADKNGEAVEVTDNGDGTWSFEQPASDVVITVAFACDGGELCPSSHLSDVDQTSWYHGPVDWAVATGAMSGYGDGTFGPLNGITRGEMAAVLWNLAGNPEADASSLPVDCDPNAFYAEAVAWALEAGVFGGYDGGSFGPADQLTREQAACVLMNLTRLQGGDVSASADLSSYPDAGDVSSFAEGAMSWAVAEGVLSGHDAGNGVRLLKPGQTCTRAELAALMMNLTSE